MRSWRSSAQTFASRLQQMIARGAYPASIVPFGYRKDRAKRLQPDPTTGPYVTELFRRRPQRLIARCGIGDRRDLQGLALDRRFRRIGGVVQRS